MNMKNEIGLNIKKYRQDRKWSQDELAEKVYSTKSTISKWESGDIVPSVEVIKIIAKALGVSLYQILGEKTPLAGRILNFFGKFLLWGFVWVHIDITFTGIVVGLSLAMGLVAAFGGIAWFSTVLASSIINQEFDIFTAIGLVTIILGIPTILAIFGAISLGLYIAAKEVHMFSRKHFWKATKSSYKLKELLWLKRITKKQWIIFGCICAFSLIFLCGSVGIASTLDKVDKLFNIKF